jgi:hypothetical protein
VTSKQRLEACWSAKAVDHIPLTTWCFGLHPNKSLIWENDGTPVPYWYSLRMEHLHTLTYPWTLEDDFKRVMKWHSLGIDDMLDISIPWGTNPEVTWEDSIVPKGKGFEHPVMMREYRTPSGTLRHAIKKTGENPGKGWPIQPDHVPLFEDYNIPRGVEHAVSTPDDVPVIKQLYMAPDKGAREWFERRMAAVAPFTREHGIAVQAWSSFGMDAIVWLAGAEGAILLAMDNPSAFAQLMDIVTEADLGRTELACSNLAVDIIVERGWYSSTDFWSPKLFDEFLFPHISQIAKLSHNCGKKFAYTMTTGVELLGERLADAGVDILYFIDPIQDTITLEKARETLCKRMTLVGGINTPSLSSTNREQIHNWVKCAIDLLGPTNRFILHPVDALFPDTPWESVEILIEAWERYR